MSEPPIDPPVEEEPPIILGWDEAEVTGDRINVFDAPIVAGDPQGKRIEISASGLRVYDEGSVETASLDGNLTLAKVDAGEGLEASPNVQAGAPGLNFAMPGYAGGTPPQVVAFSENNTGGFAPGTLLLKSAETTTNTSGRGEVQLRSGEIRALVYGGVDHNTGMTVAGGSAQIASRGNAARAVANSDGNAELLSSGGASVAAGANGSAELTSSSGASVVARPDGGARITATNGAPVYVTAPGGFRIVSAPTDASWPNAYIDPATGTVLRSTVDVAGIIAGLEARIAALEA